MTAVACARPVLLVTKLLALTMAAARRILPDDAPCAVFFSVSTLKSPLTSKRRKWRDSAFEEVFIDPIIFEVFPFPWARDQSEMH